MAQNPNQTVGIILTIKKVHSVRISLPCQRLERRIKEFLLLAKVQPSEYRFVLESTGESKSPNRLALRVSAKSGSTIDFELHINLPGGEFFIGTLSAPVKCNDDKLVEVFARTATQICSLGWHSEKETTSKLPALPPPTSKQVANELLAQKIKTWVKAADVEIAGCKRSINRMNDTISGLEETKLLLQEQLRGLGH